MTFSKFIEAMQRGYPKVYPLGLGGCPFAWGVPHERHSTLRVQSPFGTLARCAVQEAIAQAFKTS